MDRERGRVTWGIIRTGLEKEGVTVQEERGRGGGTVF